MFWGFVARDERYVLMASFMSVSSMICLEAVDRDSNSAAPEMCMSCTSVAPEWWRAARKFLKASRLGRGSVVRPCRFQGMPMRMVDRDVVEYEGVMFLISLVFVGRSW